MVRAWNKISMGSKDIAFFSKGHQFVSRAKRTQRTCATPSSHMTGIGSPRPRLPSLVRHPCRRFESRTPCTWDLFPYAHPIGRTSSAALCGACTAAAALPSDHHHLRPRPSQTRHGVIHHPPCSRVSGHFQSQHPVATLMPACCPGLRNLIFDGLQLHRTVTRMQTRKRPRRPCSKRSRVANRRTSCCAVSHCPS